VYEPLPISVIIPHRQARGDWFRRNCLPQVIENNPAEIIIEDWEGGACEKRNIGAAKASQPFLMFVDDDSYLYEFALVEMLRALKTDPGATFAYSDARHVKYPGIPYPNENGIRRAMPWNVKALKNGNYVETMSLLRREAFPGFDSKMKRFQDWDLWLTLSEKGHRGVYIPQTLFELHHFDVGISASIPLDESLAAIRLKHGSSS
jgi:glycosyltransferase involved in cell wall biosynthesis